MSIKLSVYCPVLLKFHCFKGIDRQTQAPIDSLPTEIVCKILTTAIETTLPRGDAHRIRKPELAAVCRRWRDIIVNTPLLWTYIEISPKWLIMSLLKAHVKRSRECPLVIVCHHLSQKARLGTYHDEILALDFVFATVHRWRSLTLIGYSIGGAHLTSKFSCTVFPLLTHLSIQHDLMCRPILHPEHVPALKYLETSMSAFIPNAPCPPALEELTIDSFCPWPSRSLELLSLQGLKALSFCGHTGEERIQPDIVHLPLLTRLSLNVSHAKQLLRILSAPSLTRIIYQQKDSETLFTAFNGIPSKWANVHELGLRLVEWGFSNRHQREDYCVGLTALCLAAPEVRSIEVMAEDLDQLLACQQGVYPIEHWVHLEQFTVIGRVHWLNEKWFHYIVRWLKKRRAMRKPVLKVSFLMNGDKAELNRIVLDDIGQYCDGVDLHIMEGENYMYRCEKERKLRWCGNDYYDYIL